MKNNDTNNVIIHLNLVKQQLTPNGNNTTTRRTSVKETTLTGQANRPCGDVANMKDFGDIG
jgi:hypothetical protein